MMRRLRQLLPTWLLMVLIVLALTACGDDGEDADATDGDAAVAGDEEDVERDDDADDGPGDGDESASTFGFRGEDIDLDLVECRGQFEADGVEMRVYGADPQETDDDRWDGLVLSVDQRDDGADVTVRLGDPLDGEAFDGHRWTLPGEEREQVDISEAGTSGDLLLEFEEGDEGPDGQEDAEVSFDIVC